MDWKLVFGLSLFGLAMAIATVFFIPSNIEPLFWLAIFVICAVIIARSLPARHFLHGLMIGIVNSVWVTAAHIVFLNTYLANHAKEAAMMQTMPMPGSPRLMMALTGPVVGVISGIVLGLFAWIASKFTRPRVATTA